ncbi:MAG: sigma-70 family RNA polymerase sigma factor [Armatimonadota bacterium]|nr:sigma-70 family RNA polymerase sigma factor [Armatimonadota bacterium]
MKGRIKTLHVSSALESKAGSLGLFALFRRKDGVEKSEPLGKGDTVTGGNLPSFETVLRLYHKRVFSLIYRLLGDMEDAADLTQETFVKAYRAYPKFQGSADAIFPWLCRISINSCKNKFREINRRERYEWRSLDEPVSIEEEQLFPEISDKTGDPATVIERQELENKVQESIQLLPPEYRAVVILRDMHGLSYQEIAGAVGISVELVKVRLFRAREIIRRKLSAYLQPLDEIP